MASQPNSYCLARLGLLRSHRFILGLLNSGLDVGEAGASRDFNFHPNRVLHGPSLAPVAFVPGSSSCFSSSFLRMKRAA